MTITEMYDMVKKIHAGLVEAGEYEYIGLRFENKDREIGEACENSKHNPDRNDERDFPEFGTEEYNELPELDGTSAWDIKSYDFRLEPWQKPDSAAKDNFLADHAYIIAGNKKGYHDDPDNGEILIKDAVVVAKLF